MLRGGVGALRLDDAQPEDGAGYSGGDVRAGAGGDRQVKVRRVRGLHMPPSSIQVQRTQTDGRGSGAVQRHPLRLVPGTIPQAVRPRRTCFHASQGVRPLGQRALGTAFVLNLLMACCVASSVWSTSSVPGGMRACVSIEMSPLGFWADALLFLENSGRGLRAGEMRSLGTGIAFACATVFAHTRCACLLRTCGLIAASGLARLAWQVTPTLGLQAMPHFVKRCVQLFDMLEVRHGVMLLGASGTGKSSCLKALQAALQDLANRSLPASTGHHCEIERGVHIRTISPKALTIERLYGCAQHSFSLALLLSPWRL